jgi:hypothetical protein
VCTAEGERGRGSQMKREFLVREKREEKKINTLGFLSSEFSIYINSHPISL